MFSTIRIFRRMMSSLQLIFYTDRTAGDLNIFPSTYVINIRTLPCFRYTANLVDLIFTDLLWRNVFKFKSGQIMEVYFK